MKFYNSYFINNNIHQKNIKLLIRPIFILLLINITKIVCTQGDLLNKNATTLLKANTNNPAINTVNWEKLNSTMLNLINILDSLIDSTDKNNNDRDILALEFVKKNRELQSQLKFLDKNKYFYSKRRKLKSFFNSQKNENQFEDKKELNSFNTNIKIKNTFAKKNINNNDNNNEIQINSQNNFPDKKENVFENESEEEEENEKEPNNNNVFFIENKNTFSTSNNPDSNINEFNLQIQFSNGINKQKIYQKNVLNSNNNKINFGNKIENSNDDKVDNFSNLYKNQNKINYNNNNANSYNQIRNMDGILADDLKSKLTEKKILRKLKNQKLFGLNYFDFLLEDKFRSAKNIECNESNCSSPNICLDQSICKCGQEFANFAEVKNDENSTKQGSKLPVPTVYCSYKRKKQIVTFMLEFFLFFGMGHVYSGNYIIGFSKFVFFVLLIVFKFKSKKSQKEIEIEEEEGNNKSKKINWAHLLILLLAVIWYLVDIIFLALSKYVDGNGVPMLSW